MKLNAFALCFSLVSSILLPTAPAVAGESPAPTGGQTDGNFRKVILDADQQLDGRWTDSLKDPMELAVAQDGRVFYAQRNGIIKMWSPDTRKTVELGKVQCFEGLEEGMIGMTLDPKFVQNGWIYLNHSVPETGRDANGKKSGVIRVSRYTVKGQSLDLASEKKLIDIPVQRDECCHVGGSLGFDKDGNLFIAIGDNTNPFDSDGYSPHDERPGRSAWDSQKSSANMNDLRGGISRIHPEPDGTYTIPKGNLFPPGTPGTRPEVYVKGTRNGFRLSIDQRTSILYWGDVGPDANSYDASRGPGGMDAVMQAKAPGFFGWPYTRGDNKPYARIDFAARAKYMTEKAAYDKTMSDAKKAGLPRPDNLQAPQNYLPASAILFDPEHPMNHSPNNTGRHDLPPTQPAFIYYANSPSTRFPAVNSGGGRTAMAGPVYYFDPNLKSDRKLPQEYDRTLFIYEWSRNWIVAVHLDEQSNIAKNADGSARMERFCPNMTFKRPMDMELGPDGCLYLIEWGTAWSDNKDTQIVRLEYAGKN